jgi:hypothetical protein
MEGKVSTTILPQYIFIYVYMEVVSGMRKVREGIGGVKVKLKGTSRPSDKNPIGEYISNRSNRDFFYRNFLLDFSTPIFYENFLRGYFVLLPSPSFPYQDFLLLSLSVKQVLRK